jgi:crossover junction endodeoxyribonuclease RuvC
MARSRRQLWAKFVEGRCKASDVAHPMLPKQAYDGYVLGIDPSVRGTGLALLHAQKGKVALLQSHTLRMAPKLSFAECLGTIFKAVHDLLAAYPIGHTAIEGTIYVQNNQTAHKLGAAKGAAIAAAYMKGWSIFEYPPSRIKQAVSGSGRASKEQILRLIHQHLQLSELNSYDEADAIAAGLCHIWTHREGLKLD